MYQFTCTEQTASRNTLVHRSPQTLGPSVRKLVRVTLLALQFGGGIYILAKFVEPWSKPHPKLYRSLPNAVAVIYLRLLPLGSWAPASPRIMGARCVALPLSSTASRKAKTARNFTSTFVALCSTCRHELPFSNFTPI